MTPTIVDRLHVDFKALVEFLDKGAEPSLRSTAEENFRKALLLAAASYFEIQVIGAIVEFVDEVSNKNGLTTEFVRRKGLGRQYHTLFDWEGNNANQFYGLFGDPFRIFMDGRLKAKPELADSVRAFLEVGRERNRLVHQDYGTYSLEKTADEIYQLYQGALLFVGTLKALLHDCSRGTGP